MRSAGSSVLNFVSRADLLRREENAAARAALLKLREEQRPEVAFVYDEAIARIDGHSMSSEGRPFIMVGAAELAIVTEHLAANSRRPLVAVRLWNRLFSYVDRYTGDISVSRGQLADMLGVEPKVVSEVTSELVKFGALSRRLVPLAGMRGRGVVRYTMNPLAGTHLPKKAREVAQSAARPLNVVSIGPERRSRAPSFEPVVL